MQILRSRRVRSSGAADPVRHLGACGAPRSSMYFGPDGNVRACCVNTTYTLGKIGERSIREIWEGARIASLRDALDAHDYSLGCRDCEHRVAAGDRAWSTAPQYDDYLGDEPGEYPRRMDFILSITCNLQCAMCDGELSSSIRMHREKRPPMPPAYGDAFFEELVEFLPHLDRAVFLGGEPFVAREPQRVFDLMIESGFSAPVQVVTNGTQWNARVERYLRELPMNLAVSVDGWTAETLESLRVGVERDRVFDNVDRYRAAVADHGGTVAFHYCLMRQNWHEFGRFLLEADRRELHVIVMTVTGPVGFSLWDLPPAEMRDIRDALEREGESLAPRLGRNRQVWDDELARIDRHLAQLDALGEGGLPSWVTTSWGRGDDVPVAIGAKPETTSPTPVAAVAAVDAGARALAARLEADLATWSGRAPTIVHVVGGAVASVDVEPWAAWLDPDGWIGRDLTELPDLLADRFDAVGEPALTDHGAGVVESTTVVTLAGEDLELRAVASPWAGSTGIEGRVALAATAALDVARLAAEGT